MYQAARIKVARVEARIVRTPIEIPVRASFGMMRDRPARSGVIFRLLAPNIGGGWRKK
jgi:hypothetical protein